ncbi:unnamed protein product [Miscanthus lutarioriparius]|uniref:Protein kinase domain-containing protein n=1 Tax=Miscanthus lutarioriparius TaxID=422564 RepID=A0A811NPF2_9POAL|nr:unnamed protein product [Miscanthus lutarioriparius]
MTASQMHKVDGYIEFSYEELSDVTNNFSMEHKIGQGGFGSVYAGLIGEKAAIKKMDTKSSQEFLAELKALTHVHRSNLVGDLRFFRDKANLELIVSVS